MNGSQYYFIALQIFLSSLENGVGQTIQRSEIPKDKEGMYQEEDAVQGQRVPSRGPLPVLQQGGSCGHSLEKTRGRYTFTVFWVYDLMDL